MDQGRRNFWILGICVVLVSSSFTMIVPFLSIFLYDLGANDRNIDIWAGVVFSAFYFVGAVMGPVWGALADKYGKKKMIIRAGLGLAVVYSLISVVRTPWELLIVRLLHGFVGGFVPAALALVAASSPRDRVGYNLGMMQSAFATGSIMGPLFGGALFEWFGMRLSALIPAAMICLATVAVIIWVREDGRDREAKADAAHAETANGETANAEAVNADMAHAETEQGPGGGGIRAVLHHSVLLGMLLLLFVFHAAFNALQPLLSLYIAELSGQIEGAVLSSGLVLSLVGIATVIAAPRWGLAGGRYGYPRVLAWCFIFAGALGIALRFPGTTLAFAIVYFLFGLFVAGIVPLINTIAVHNAEARFQGRLFGLTKSASHSGSMTGGLCGGVLGLWLGISNVFVVCGAILLFTGLAVQYKSGKWLNTGRKEVSA